MIFLLGKTIMDYFGNRYLVEEQNIDWLGSVQSIRSAVLSVCLCVFCHTLGQMGSQDWRAVEATLEINKSQNKINDLGIGNDSVFNNKLYRLNCHCHSFLCPDHFGGQFSVS